MTTTMSLENRTVGELAVEMPIAIRLFESWRIDYCCGGKTPLSEALAAAGQSMESFLLALESLATAPEAEEADAWRSATLTEVATRIVATYHGWTREELQTLEPLAEKVNDVHGHRRAELVEVLRLVREISREMLPHMLKEEQILFPYVDQLEEAAAAKRHAPTPFFGTVKNPVRMMMLEHDRVADLLARLREITEGYVAPPSACFSYRELYRRLAEFEARTHEHVHVENNLYFPRAVELEDRIGEPAEFVDGCCQH